MYKAKFNTYIGFSSIEPTVKSKFKQIVEKTDKKQCHLFKEAVEFLEKKYLKGGQDAAL